MKIEEGDHLSAVVSPVEILARRRVNQQENAGVGSEDVP